MNQHRLTDLSFIRSIMEENGISFQKKFGQNFLCDPSVPARIAEECGAEPQSAILEIGPGIGTLTEQLAQRFSKVIAIEIDPALCRILPKTLSCFENVTILEGDAMKLDLASILHTYAPGMKVSVCANLPYYITTPVICKLLESRLPFDTVTVMIQKEVAARLTAKAGSADYGAITVSTAYYAKTERLFSVPAGCFVPMPKVDSAVVRFTRYSSPPCSVFSEEMLFRVIRAAFSMRRKTLCNALVASFPALDRNGASAAIAGCGLPVDIRGERLTLQQFSELTNALAAFK